MQQQEDSYLLNVLIADYECIDRFVPGIPGDISHIELLASRELLKEKMKILIG